MHSNAAEVAEKPILTVEGLGDFDIPQGKRLVLALEDEAGVDQLHKLMVSDAIGRSIRIGLVRSGRRIDVELVPSELAE